jgi:hypothetical protein
MSIENFRVDKSVFSVLVGLLFVGLVIMGSVGATPVVNVLVDNLQPSWTAAGGGGVYALYAGPPAHDWVSPGATAVYDGREAGIIKAGFGFYPGTIDNWDEGLFGFKPTVTIDQFASLPLTFDVENQAGINPVWMTIEIDTGVVGDRDDNTVYQFVPTTNPAGWHTVNAAAGQWQKWNDNNGDTTGNPPISLNDVAAGHTGLNVVRAYLRLGMGDSYYNGGTGTTAWVDKVTLGGITYDFVVPSYWYVDPLGLDTNEGTLASPFLTIQHALDEAPSGATVIVSAGTYEERIHIDRYVTLVGAGMGQSIIDATSFGVAGNVIDITAKSGNTVIQGFDIVTGDFSNGIHSSGGTDGSGSIEILNNHIISTYYGDDQFGIIAGYGDLRKLIISNNRISNTYSNSILVELQMGETEISGNTLEGAFPSIFFMTYDGNDVSTLQNISGNTIDMSSAGAGSGVAGIGVNPSTYYVTADRRTGKYENFEISNNVITGVNTDLSIKGISIGENSVDGTAGGFTNLRIVGNTISGTNGKGIQFFGHITGADVHDNILSGLYQGVKGFTYESSFYPENNNIYNNQITGASDKLAYWTGSSIFNLENNWWGSDNELVIAPMVSDNVDFSPFCEDSACATRGTGIPPTFTTGLLYDGNGDHVSGSMSTQFNLDTRPRTPGLHELTLTAPIASESLAEDYYQFTLSGAYPQLTSYFHAKPWYPAFSSWVDGALAGTQPFFYLKATGTGGSQTYSLVDGFVYDAYNPGTETTLRIDGDYPYGTYTYTGTIRDIAGNPTVLTITLNVIDRTPPVVTVPSTITAEANTIDGAIVTFSASAIDDLDGSVPVTCNHNSGDIYSMGTTNVNCQATDLHGNTGSSTFDINVQDTTPPVITMNGISPVTIEAKSTYIDAGASALDIFDGDVTGSIVIGNGVNTYVVGTYTVTYDVVDSNGNPATQVIRTVDVIKTGQTISFGGLAGKVYGDPDFEVSATASSGLQVTFTASDGCMVSGNTVHLTNVPSCTITAHQAGDDVYNPASDVSQTFNVQKKYLNIEGVAVPDKVYDGSADAVLNTSSTNLAGVVPGDVVTLVTSGISGIFDSKDVGIGKTVFVGGITLNGADRGKYTFHDLTVLSSISTRPVTVAASTDTKEYDGTPSSTGTPAIISGSLAGADSATWVQTFDSKSAGANKVLTPTGTVIDGNGGNNYAVTFVPDTEGVITTKAVTISGVAAMSKTYDGSVASTLNLAGVALVGEVGGDDVTLNPSSATGDFSDANVGTGKNVAVTGMIILGTDASNYVLTEPIAIADITTRAITITADNLNKMSGGDDPTLTSTVTGGSLASADVLSGALTRDTGENIGSYTINQGTLTAGLNYAITFLPGIFTITNTNSTPIIANSTNVTVSSNNTEIVVPPGQNITNINVPSDVPDDAPVTLDLSLNTNTIGNETNITIPNDLTLTRDTTSSIDYQVFIPIGTTISGDNWNGIITVPTVTTAGATPITDSGYNPSEVHAVEVGFPDVKLTFSQPVRLLIVGQAGKLAGYTRSGVFTQITTTCNADVLATVSAQLSAEGDCKIDVSSDMVIWTMHFTQFVSYWQTNPPASPGYAVSTASSCAPNWQCTAWTACAATGTQTRTCTDLNSCSAVSSSASKPSETQACVFAGSSTPGVNYCGDETCGSGETCSNCADDCGPCAQEQPQPPAQPSTPEATGPSVTGALTSVSGAGAGASSSLAGLVVLAVIAGLVIYAFVIRPGRATKKDKATQSSTLPA